MKQDVIDDVEQCVIHYNQAVLLYHQRKYTEAFRIVDRIYKFIEPMGKFPSYLIYEIFNLNWSIIP